MALLDNLLNVGTNAMTAAATHLSLHSAAPDATGSNACTSARVPAGWPAASLGDAAVSNKVFTGIAASGAVTHVGLWSALTAGTFYGSYPIGAGSDFAANAAGEYTLTSLTINGSST